jgi:hypothetical protein
MAHLYAVKDYTDGGSYLSIFQQLLRGACSISTQHTIVKLSKSCPGVLSFVDVMFYCRLVVRLYSLFHHKQTSKHLHKPYNATSSVQLLL